MTDAERLELTQLAREGAAPEYDYKGEIDALWAAVRALQQSATPPDEKDEWPEYVQPTGAGEDHSTEATRYTTAEWLSQFREYKNLLGPNGYIIKNDEMSNWIYPTRLKNHKITCKTCGREIMSVDAIRGYCSTCAKDVFQTCAGCGETVYKDHLRFGYCSSCNDVVVKHLICQSCGKLFDYKRGEQLYFRSKGFNDPIRCQECRANKTKGTSTTYSPSGLKSQSTTYTPPKTYTPTSLPSRPSSRPATTPVQNPTPSTVSSSKKKKLCFITTAVCEYFGKPDDCWELTLLRHFRDHYMKSTVTGRALVEQYYTIAPDIVRVLDESDQKDLIYSMLWHHYIRPCLRLIVEEKPEECQQLYQAMVEMLINNLNGLDKSVQTSEEYETDETDDVISTPGIALDDRAVAIDTLNSIAERSITVVTIKVGSTDADYALQGLNANTKGENSSLAAAVNFIRQRKEDLVSNPTPRIAVALCLDNSGSMEGEPIAELNEGIRAFYDAVLGDEMTRYSVEVCTVSFGGETVLVQDFCAIERQEIPVLTTCQETTHMGEGVNMALDMLERRKKEYQEAGVDYYQPWLVLMTDGEPGGEDTRITQDAMRRATDLVNNCQLTIFPIGIGAEANRETLRGFSPKTAPMKLQGLKFKEFFQWISKSCGPLPVSGNGVMTTDTEWGQLEP